MATTLCFSSTTLLHSSIDFYSASKFSAKRLRPFSPSKHGSEFSLLSPNSGVNRTLEYPNLGKWRAGFSFFSSFLNKNNIEIESLKQELLEAIAPLDRGAAATPEDQKRIDQNLEKRGADTREKEVREGHHGEEQIARKLEALNKVKEPLKATLLNGKWELLYTTSKSILQTERPKFLRPNGKIYQAINVDTLRAQNMETWPFFNQATANLVPLNARRVAVKFDTFKIAAVIPIKSRGSGRGQLEITFLDEELRISRGNEGNLFILRMVDPLYRVPL